jgi:hypothetical protein
MPYSHYWSRVTEFDRSAFAQAVEDVRLILSRARDMGMRLAGPLGKGKPHLGVETIAFNGAINCGHRYRDLGEPWPAVEAVGIEEVDPPYDPTAEPYVGGGGGPMLLTRACGGNCAGAPFLMDRKYIVRDWERPGDGGRYDCQCDTHFKPYDLIVTSALVRLKERLGDAIIVSSEEPERGFEDAKRLCRELFGFASRFEVEEPQTKALI